MKYELIEYVSNGEFNGKQCWKIQFLASSNSLDDLDKLRTDLESLQPNDRFYRIVDCSDMPTHCLDCGVFLMGGATIHKPDCDIGKMIKESQK